MVISSWIRNLCLRLATRPIRQTARRRIGRQVPIEALECRAMLSGITITVNTTSDAASDSNISGPTVTLREAINYANRDSGNSDTITFSTNLSSSGPSTITLINGELLISNSMTIMGLGAGQLAIDGNNASRIFNLSGRASNTVTITGLTLQHGNGNGYFQSGYGGAIYNDETLILSNDTIANNNYNNNYYNNGFFGGGGGGIYNAGTLISTNDTITNNNNNYNNYFLTFNTNEINAGGGGIYNAGTLTSTNDTIANNNNNYYYNSYYYNAVYGGGGIYNAGTLTSLNDTFYRNAAISFGGGFGGGGAVFNSGGAIWNCRNTIIAGSTNGGDVFNAGSVNTTATLIGDGSLAGLPGIINATGGAASVFGTNNLSNNGGPTQTVALTAPTATNPAIGAAASLGKVTTDNGTSLSVDNATFIAAGDYLQIGKEIVLVQNVTPAKQSLTVKRAQYGTTQTFLVGDPIYLATDATGAVRSSKDLGARASQHLLTVNTNADPGSNGPILPQGTITLRNAIATANADVFPAGNTSGDTINCDASLAGNTITLNGSESLISNSMRIAGLGADQLTIDGNNASRIFDLNGSASNTVTITGLTLRHGKTIKNTGNNSDYGGAIFNNEALTLSNCTIDSNTSLAGGGIFNQGWLSSTNDMIVNNTATQFVGGGIENDGSFVSINDTIDYNTAQSDAGGIYSDGPLVSTNDTIDNNKAGNVGGGILNDWTWTSTNDTIFQNGAASGGGGVYNVSATWNSLNSIIAGSTVGGDVYNNSSTINANASLIGDSSLPGVKGIINAAGGAASIFGKNTLSKNGGPTQTVALTAPTATNPAIGVAASLGKVTTDNGTSLSVDDVTFIAVGDYLQVGNEIVLVQNVTPGTGTKGTLTVARAQYGTTQTSLVGNSIYLATDATGAVRNSKDLGARNSQHLLTVNTIADPVSTAPILPQGTMTLRNAITTANADVFPAGNTTGDTINFDAGLAGNTITLNGSELLISNSMTIAGLGADQLTIDGNKTSRIFDLNGSASNSVAITGLTLQHGNGNGKYQSGNGGAIFNNETLTLSNDMIANNTANDGYGGGIYNTSSLTSTNDTIDKNTAYRDGGGISIDGNGTLTSTNDTIDNNTASGNGGGISIDHDGTLTSSNDTIAYNTSAYDGGGIGNYGNGSLTISNDTIDYNKAKRSGGGIFNNASLTSTNDTIVYNTAGAFGGAIDNWSTLSSTNDTMAYNEATIDGGGVDNNDTMTTTNDTIDNNTASRNGGGIENQRTMTSSNDTIAYNTASNDGGGVDNNGTLSTTNDTIANDTSNRYGGGISNGWSLVSTNDTIFQNSAQSGGGINNPGSWSSLNTIVAGSTRGGDVVSQVRINATATLIGDSSLTGTTGIINASGGAPSIFGTNTLANNGGPTQTVALAVTAANPAIGAAASLGKVTADNGTSLSVDNVTFIVAGVYLQIGSEIVQVTQVTPGTGKSGTLNVERAQNGTTQTSLVGNAIFLATDETGAVRSGSNDLGALASQHQLIVNTTADTPINDANIQGSTVSLREAINFVNKISNVAEPFTITFASGLTASGPATITLNGNELLITNSMTITGLGADQLTIDGNNASRIFDLNGSTKNTVTITGLTLQHGNGKGRFGDSGGAILDQGTLTLSNDTIVNNTANGNGGGISIDGNGTLTSMNATIDNNEANGYGGGVSIDHNGSLSSTNDTIDNNTSTNDGGGIYNNSKLTTTDDTILSNTAMSGGGVFNAKSYSSNSDTVDYNSASVNGGGISNGGTLTITSSTIDYNMATQNGGGIFSSGTVTSTDDTIANNSTSVSGGGIYVSGVTTSTNDTIAKNTATKNGGGIDNAGTLTTANVTIYGNSAAGGGGVYNYGGTNVAVWNSLNTIVADSLSGNDVFQFGTIHATAMLIDDSLLRAPGITNVSGGPTSIFGSNTLADNGGPTQTVKLVVGSPAIGAAKALGNVIANGDLGTTLKVDSTTFLAPGDELKIGTEIVLVQAVSAGVLTVARAQAGTTQTSLNGQPIFLAYDQRGIARSVNDIGSVEMVTPTITITQNYVYTGTPIQAVATVTVNGSTVSDITPTITYYMPGLSVPLSSAPTRAGTYTVVAMFAGNDIYTSQSTSTTITIGKATPVVSVADAGGTYNGSLFPATALVRDVSGSSNASLENVTPTLAYYPRATATGPSSTTAPTLAGTYTVVATFAGSSDYTAQSASTTFIISKATPLVSVTDSSGTYNGLPFPATALVQGVSGSRDASLENVTPALTYYGGPTATGPSSTTPPISAGIYTVVALFAGSTDYTVQSASTTFTIGTATPVVSVTDVGGTYNGLPFPATGTVTGVGNAVLGTPSFKYYLSTDLNFTSPLSGAPSNAGSYIVVASFAANGNYSGASQTTGFAITPAPVTLQIGNVTQIAGTAENLAADLGTTISTGINNEKFNIQYSSAGDNTTALIGTYPITGQLSDGTAKQSNYIVTLLPGTLNVIRKTISVNSTSDATVAGKMTLRQAIFQANSDLNADQIVFDPSLSGSIVLTQGELAITHSMLIVGPGANKLTISGNKVSRIFDINGPSMTANSLLCVTISGLTLSGGNGAASTNNGNGGAIYNHGQLTLTNDIITANNSSGYGGGLYNVGTVNSSGNTFASNVSSFGGGLNNDAGGIYRSTNDTFWGNTAYYGGAIKNVGLNDDRRYDHREQRFKLRRRPVCCWNVELDELDRGRKPVQQSHSIGNLCRHQHRQQQRPGDCLQHVDRRRFIVGRDQKRGQRQHRRQDDKIDLRHRCNG